jgi:hypothetical protein
VFALRQSLLLSSHLRRRSLSLLSAVVAGELLGARYPVGLLVWRLFIPAGMDPESRL